MHLPSPHLRPSPFFHAASSASGTRGNTHSPPQASRTPDDLRPLSRHSLLQVDADRRPHFSRWPNENTAFTKHQLMKATAPPETTAPLLQYSALQSRALLHLSICGWRDEFFQETGCCFTGEICEGETAPCRQLRLESSSNAQVFHTHSLLNQPSLWALLACLSEHNGMRVSLKRPKALQAPLDSPSAYTHTVY